LLQARFDEVAALLSTRRIQTNEVGRAAAILPALGLAAARLGRPLALVELGSSAGLNLFLDRFGYDYGTGRVIGDPASPVRLGCEQKGPLCAPIPTRMPMVVRRCGIDLAPVDVTDDEQCRWLEACCWPDPPERLARLRAAIALARSKPPLLHRGNVLDVLPSVLAAVPPDAVPCILSTWMIAYLSDTERATLAEIVHGEAVRRDVVCITGEYAGVSPFVPPPARPAAIGDGRLGTLVGLSIWQAGAKDARALCWMQSHGGWIDWLDADTAYSGRNGESRKSTPSA
jgi:hypothetical protein